MKQLTKENDLIGKTISSIVRSEFSGNSVMALKFTDGSFVGIIVNVDEFNDVFPTVSNDGLGGFLNPVNSTFQYEMGFITREKNEEVVKLAQEQYIKRLQESEIEQLKKLKEKYPNE